jgi:hypothetical protein
MADGVSWPGPLPFEPHKCYHVQQGQALDDLIALAAGVEVPEVVDPDTWFARMREDGTIVEEPTREQRLKAEKLARGLNLVIAGWQYGAGS